MILLARSVLVLIMLAGAGLALAQEVDVFQNVKVYPNPFSPNGDGKRELLRVEYTLTVDASSLTAVVRRSDGDSVRALLEGASENAGTHTLTWDGLDDHSVRAPDGVYYLGLTAHTSTGKAQAQSPYFVLDTTTPVAQVIDIWTNPYSPDLPGAPDSLRVRVSVSRSQSEDHISVTVGPQGEAATDILTLIPPFDGDGDYLCHWKDEDRDDGVYDIRIFMEDAAGNSSTHQAEFTLDKAPPLVGVYRPSAPFVFRELPDSIFGKAYDDADVYSVEISYDGGEHFSPIPGAMGADTVYWVAPLKDSLPAEEDEHTVQVRATDLLGHVGAGGDLDGPSTLQIHCDNQAPPPPAINPLPSVVREPRLQVTGTASDADTVEIYLNDFDAPKLVLAVSATGTFAGGVTLREGVNELAAVSIDEAGNRSSFSSTVTIEYQREFGVLFNERFRPGDAFEVKLERPAREITIALYSTSGRKVRILQSGGPSSDFSLPWDGNDSDGTPLNSGVYLCHVRGVFEDGTVMTEKKFVALIR